MALTRPLQGMYWHALQWQTMSESYDIPLRGAVVHVDVLREGGKEGRSKVRSHCFTLPC